MKKIFLIVYLVFSSFSLMGENIIIDGVVYDQETFEPFSGVVKTKGYEKHMGDVTHQWYQYVVNYKNGLRHGKSEIFFENGDLKQRETFKDGKRENYSLTLLKGGQTYIHGKYLNGLKQSIWEKSFLSPIKENPNSWEYRERYKNGKLDGLQESFYDLGGPKLRQLYLWGKKEGLSEKFFLGYKGVSQLESVGNYKNDIKEGLWKEYYSDGQLKEKRNYKNGKSEGLVMVFHPNGQLNWRQNFKNGEPDGLNEIFGEDGSLLLKSCYKNDEMVNMSYCEN